MHVPLQSGHDTTCIHPVIDGEMHLHSHPTGMIWQAGLICIFFRLEARMEITGCDQLGLSRDTTSPNEGRHRLPSLL